MATTRKKLRFVLTDKHGVLRHGNQLRVENLICQLKLIAEEKESVGTSRGAPTHNSFDMHFFQMHCSFEVGDTRRGQESMRVLVSRSNANAKHGIE